MAAVDRSSQIIVCSTTVDMTATSTTITLPPGKTDGGTDSPGARLRRPGRGRLADQAGSGQPGPGGRRDDS